VVRGRTAKGVEARFDRGLTTVTSSSRTGPQAFLRDPFGNLVELTAL